MNWQQEFMVRLDALSDDATHAQKCTMVQWVIDNVPIPYWMSAADRLIDIDGDMYTEIQMRYHENQGWQY